MSKQSTEDFGAVEVTDTYIHTIAIDAHNHTFAQTYATPKENCNVNYGLWRLTENELMVASREGWGEGKIREFGMNM